MSDNKTHIKIAIPTAEGRLDGHFGGARHFTFLEVDRRSRAIASSKTVEAPPHQPGVFPRWLREQGAEVIIVGGIGQRALAIFAQHGIQVCGGQPGAAVESLVTAYLDSQLAEPQGCGGHEHHHYDHDHEHHHGGGQCHQHQHGHE